MYAGLLAGDFRASVPPIGCDGFTKERRSHKPVLLTFDDAYEDLAEFALPVLRRYGFGGAVFIVTKRVGETNLWDQAQGSGLLRLMNEEQIRFWAGQGIEFGAHSRTHCDLTKLSAEELDDEVAGSKSDLAALLGSPVESFAYPFGYYNDAVRDAVRRHFAIALTTDEGINDLRSDPHLMRRANVRRMTLRLPWPGLCAGALCAIFTIGGAELDCEPASGERSVFLPISRASDPVLSSAITYSFGCCSPRHIAALMYLTSLLAALRTYSMQRVTERIGRAAETHSMSNAIISGELMGTAAPQKTSKQSIPRILPGGKAKNCPPEHSPLHGTFRCNSGANKSW